MANIARVRTTWQGNAIVGPGVTTFYFDEAASGYLTRVNGFWNALKNVICVGINLQTANTGDLLDENTGAITGTWTDGTSSTVATLQSGNYAAGVGARIKWQTNGIRGKRRVRGSTFVVPLTVAAYDAGGTLSTTVIDACNTAAGLMIAGGSSGFGIWSRPVGGTGGQLSDVVGYQTLDQVSWLRTRRI